MDVEALLAPAMLDGVLDQRLQQEARDAPRAGACSTWIASPQPIAEARLLHARDRPTPATSVSTVTMVWWMLSSECRR